MNNYSINLSSTSSSSIQTLPVIEFDDHTTLNVDFSQVSESILPIYLKINWGDGSEEISDVNNIYTSNGEVNPLKFSPILSKIYSHEYYPSGNSLYKSLTAQFLVEYSDGNYCWFIQPIEIRTYDYFESIEDLLIMNVYSTLDQYNSKEYHFKTLKDGYLVEMQGS